MSIMIKIDQKNDRKMITNMIQKWSQMTKSDQKGSNGDLKWAIVDQKDLPKWPKRRSKNDQKVINNETFVTFDFPFLFHNVLFSFSYESLLSDPFSSFSPKIDRWLVVVVNRIHRTTKRHWSILIRKTKEKETEFHFFSASYQ